MRGSWGALDGAERFVVGLCTVELAVRGDGALSGEAIGNDTLGETGRRGCSRAACRILARLRPRAAILRLAILAAGRLIQQVGRRVATALAGVPVPSRILREASASSFSSALLWPAMASSTFFCSSGCVEPLIVRASLVVTRCSVEPLDRALLSTPSSLEVDRLSMPR